MDTALGKGLAVLEAVAAAHGPVRLSRVADDLGLQKSSVHRILQNLVAAGWVAQDDDTGLYSATLKVWEIGAGIVEALPVRRAATPILHRLHRDTGETVSLTVLDGDDVVYLDKIVAPRPMGFTTHVGSRIPAPLTVAGRVMLAHEPDPRSTIERVAAAVGTERLDVPAALADVERALDQGYLVGRGRRERGIVGIASAVPGRDGRAVAGLTVSAPVQRADDARRDDIIESLLVATSDLAEAIGRS